MDAAVLDWQDVDDAPDGYAYVRNGSRGLARGGAGPGVAGGALWRGAFHRFWTDPAIRIDGDDRDPCRLVQHARDAVIRPVDGPSAGVGQHAVRVVGINGD